MWRRRRRRHRLLRSLPVPDVPLLRQLRFGVRLLHAASYSVTRSNSRSFEPRAIRYPDGPTERVVPSDSSSDGDAAADGAKDAAADAAALGDAATDGYTHADGFVRARGRRHG